MMNKVCKFKCTLKKKCQDCRMGRQIVWECFLLINHVGTTESNKEDGSKIKHLAYSKDLFFEFLTPSRRSHPHVEPLLATYEIFVKANKWLNCFMRLQEINFPGKSLNLEAFVCSLPLKGSSLLFPSKSHIVCEKNRA